MIMIRLQIINISISILFLLSGHVFADNSDSLLNIWKSDSPVPDRINAIIGHTTAIQGTYPDSAIMLLDQAVQLAQEMDYSDGMGDILFAKGIFFQRYDDYAAALESFLAAKSIIQKDSRYMTDSSVLKLYSDVLNGIGVTFMRARDYDNALKFLNELLDYIESLETDLSESQVRWQFFRVYHNMGSIYLTQRKFDEAEFYMTKAMAYLEKDNVYGYANITNNLGIIYYEQGEYSKSEEYLLKAKEAWNEDDNYQVRK